MVQQEQNIRLEALIAAFRQALFGRESEKIDPDQVELALEDIETAIARVEAEGGLAGGASNWPRSMTRCWPS